MKLGKTEVDALTCPADRQDRIVFDDALPGFGVRVTAAGLKVFMFQYRRGAAVRRLRLGRYGDITPAQARKLAEAARLEVSAGRDPAAERKAATQAETESKARQAVQAVTDAFTVDRLIDAWTTERLVDRRPAYRREAVRALRVNLAALLSVPANQVDAAMIRRELAEIIRRTPRAAGGVAKGPAPLHGAPGVTIRRRVRAYLHAMFAWAAKHELVPSNPVAAVHVEGRQVPRERALSDAELGEAWRAAGALGWPWGPYFRVLILTLQREAETAGMRWFELSEDLARWELPGARTKNGKPHIVFLAPPVRELLRVAPRMTIPPGMAASPFVFTTTGKAPVSGFSHAKTRLDALIVNERIKLAAEAGKTTELLVPWRIHDLRRTGVTAMARLGVRWEVADRILNHVSGAIHGVAAIYQRHEYLAEREAALKLWAEHVQKAAIGKGGSG